MSLPGAVLLDIEGTTTAISFVYDALFPFARAQIGAFLTAHWDDPAVRADSGRLGDGAATTPEAAARAAVALMDADVKDTGLKALQGRVWAAGYASGELRGHVYPDVPVALRAFAARGVPAYIYSSGSVAAQRLLFGCSDAGDLTPLLAGYFDTTTGPKLDPTSYRAIATAVALPPEALLFVTDHLGEAEAARVAGLQVAVSRRPGNPPLPPHDFRVITSLMNLF